MIMSRFFEKKAFSGCKSQIFVNGYRIAGYETELVSLSWTCIRHGDDFEWLGRGGRPSGHEPCRKSPNPVEWSPNPVESLRTLWRRFFEKKTLSNIKIT